MKIKPLLFLCCLMTLLATFSSCVQDSDLGIKEVIDPSSLVNLNLIDLSMDASDVGDETTYQELAVRMDTTYLELSNSNFMMDQLAQTNLTFKLKNSMECAFKLDVHFLNDWNEVKYTLHIPIASGTNQKPMIVETNVIIEIPELVTFKEATKVVFTIAPIPDGHQVVSKFEGTLELQADASYFLNF